MTFTDPYPFFKVMTFLKSNILKMVRLADKVTNSTVIGNHT